MRDRGHLGDPHLLRRLLPVRAALPHLGAEALTHPRHGLEQTEHETGVSSDAITLAAKVAFLSRPDSYPGQPATVDAIETRLSWVFLTPNRAWKLKKPVSYDHLEFSAINARHAACEAEVWLNRPLAPDVYLGTETLVVTRHGRLAIGSAGRPVDYLVCMRPLPGETDP